MADLTLEHHGRIAEMRLHRNALNTLSPGFVRELLDALGGLAADAGVGAVVVSSSAPKFFSAGWDLPELLRLDREGFLESYRAFVDLTIRLAALPKPTVAALGGFTVAGGAILALACDWRVMTTGKAKLGLTEVDLGVPMPQVATLLALDVGGATGARDLLLAGHLFAPHEAQERGIVDRLVEAEHVRDEALAIAGPLAAKPAEAVAAMKRALRAEFVAACERGRLADETAFAAAFFRADVRPLLEAAAEKLVPR
jgi:enoyl-CoA hydratase/carnithine racemase